MALSKEWARKIEYYLKAIPDYICTNINEFEFEGFVTQERLSLEEAVLREKQKFSAGMSWGYKWEYAWVFSEVTIPEECAGKRVVISSDNGECVVWINGKIYGAFDRQHKAITLTKDAVPGTKCEIIMEVYAGHGYPLDTGGDFMMYGAVNERNLPDISNEKQKIFKNGVLSTWNDDIYGIWLDLKTLYDLSLHLDENSSRRAEIEKVMKEACTIFSLERPYDEICYLAVEGSKRMKKVLSCKNGPTMPTAYAFGHSHLDLEWLWTDKETRRKSARTMGNQLRLIQEYPEYIYLQSQPWLLDVLKNEYPDLYEEVKAAVKNGNVVVEGGMWVESDLNLPSGESLVRQFLYGKQFITEEFGIESKMAWLPDVFGCACSLPQIMKKCDVDYFVNNKLPWVYNGGEVFPWTNFIWKGIDGTEVPVYMCEGYACENKPSAVMWRWNVCRNKEDAPMVMYPFGFGDGGGGATREHLELARRIENLEGVPHFKMTNPLQFFEDLNEYDLKHTYCGEMFYPACQGTYTSQAKTKKLNRKAELALRDAEMLSTILGENNPKQFEELWKIVLFNHFHDIIPGSSIHEVYTQAEEELAEVIEKAEHITERVLSQNVNGKKNAMTFFNSLSWDRSCLVNVPEDLGEVVDENGMILPTQMCEGKRYVQMSLPACGMGSVVFKENAENNISSEQCKENKAEDSMCLENDFIKVQFNENGEIVSILDKETDLEFLDGKGNQFRMYEDMPLFCDAWDIDSFYEEHEIPLESKAVISKVVNGELFSWLQIEKSIHNSKIMQTIILEKGKKQLDFHTYVDWKENHKLLKVFFETNLNTTEIISEMQYCHISRPAHKSTQYDADRFEVPQHKWSLLKENNRGFAILNDCKYGINAKNGTMGLTFLKAAAAPDFTADKGEHEFVYSVILNNDIASVTKSAYELNVSVPAVMGNMDSCSYFKVSAENIILDAVKPAQDESGNTIIRLYECSNSMTKCILECGKEVKKAYLTNMLEEEQQELPIIDNKVPLTFKGFEVLTVKLYF